MTGHSRQGSRLASMRPTSNLHWPQASTGGPPCRSPHGSPAPEHWLSRYQRTIVYQTPSLTQCTLSTLMWSTEHFVWHWQLLEIFELSCCLWCLLSLLSSWCCSSSLLKCPSGTHKVFLFQFYYKKAEFFHNELNETQVLPILPKQRPRSEYHWRLNSNKFEKMTKLYEINNRVLKQDIQPNLGNGQYQHRT